MLIGGANGCAGPAPSECSWSRYILMSPRDALTKGTEDQIIAHNIKVERFCR